MDTFGGRVISQVAHPTFFTLHLSLIISSEYSSKNKFSDERYALFMSLTYVYYTVIRKCCTNWHSYQQCIISEVSPTLNICLMDHFSSYWFVRALLILIIPIICSLCVYICIYIHCKGQSSVCCGSFHLFMVFMDKYINILSLLLLPLMVTLENCPTPKVR